jgi:hypothetical protein
VWALLAELSALFVLVDGIGTEPWTAMDRGPRLLLVDTATFDTR